MPYKTALAAAGAKVLAYEEFGSYQGDWFAVVDYKGSKSVVRGAFGSCSGCDDFEMNFQYPHSEKDLNGEEYQQALITFITPYLDNVMTFEEAIQYAKKEIDWDLEAKNMISWLNSLHKAHFEQQLEDLLNDKDT